MPGHFVNLLAARNWIESARWLQQRRNEDLPDAGELVAYLDLIDDVKANPECVWRIICLICELPEASDVLGLLGAGPLEDLLVVHGPSFIERVSTHASTSAQFRSALSETWKSGMREEIWDQVQAVLRAETSNVSIAGAQ